MHPYSVALNFYCNSLCAHFNMCSIALIVDSSDDVDEDDSGGLAHGDVKGSDDDCEVQAEDDDNHSNNRKEIEEQEHEVLSKSKQKSSFSLASASAASPQEEVPQRKFGYRRCRLMVSASISMLSSLGLNPDIAALCNGLNCSVPLSAHVY